MFKTKEMLKIMIGACDQRNKWDRLYIAYAPS